MYVPTSLFPSIVRQALREVKYTTGDIELILGNGLRDCYIQRRETTRNTRSEFVATADIKNNTIVISVAPEPYKCNIDSKFVVIEDPALPQIEYAAKLNQIVIYGSSLNKGKPNTTAKLYINPTNLIMNGVSLISELTERDRTILYIFGIMPRTATREALARLNVSLKEVEELVSRGFLNKSNKGFSITTLSKNLRFPQNVEGDHLW